MPLSHISTAQLARVLTLVALLCTAALQVEEASHWHVLDDLSTSHCLVCKSSSGLALPGSDLKPVFSQPKLQALVAGVQRPLTQQPLHRFVRGPPSYS